MHVNVQTFIINSNIFFYKGGLNVRSEELKLHTTDTIQMTFTAPVLYLSAGGGIMDRNLH